MDGIWKLVLKVPNESVEGAGAEVRFLPSSHSVMDLEAVKPSPLTEIVSLNDPTVGVTRILGATVKYAIVVLPDFRSEAIIPWLPRATGGTTNCTEYVPAPSAVVDVSARADKTLPMYNRTSPYAVAPDPLAVTVSPTTAVDGAIPRLIGPA